MIINPGYLPSKCVRTINLTSTDACRLLWQWPVTRPDDTIDVSYLLVRYEDLAIQFCFIQGFREAIRERDAGHLLSLITNPQVTSHPGLKRFVGRLKQNVEVILAACQFEESNGYVEGNVNRLKMMKRLMSCTEGEILTCSEFGCFVEIPIRVVLTDIPKK